MSANHHNYVRPIWIGYLHGEEGLAAMIEEFLNSVDSLSLAASLPSFPTADALSHLLHQHQNHIVVWLLPEDARNRTWVERESGLHRRCFGSDVRIYLLRSDETIIDHEGEILPGDQPEDQALRIAEQLVPDADFAQRRLVTIDNVFEISGPKVGVLPGVKLCHLAGRWKGPRPVEVRTPSGDSKAFQATAEFMRKTPPPEELRFYLLLRDARKEEVPIGSEIHLRAED